MPFIQMEFSSICFDNMGEAGPWHRGHLWSASVSFSEDRSTELVKWGVGRGEGTRKEKREEGASLLQEKLTLFQSQGWEASPPTGSSLVVFPGWVLGLWGT